MALPISQEEFIIKYDFILVSKRQIKLKAHKHSFVVFGCYNLQCLYLAHPLSIVLVEKVNEPLDLIPG